MRCSRTLAFCDAPLFGVSVWVFFVHSFPEALTGVPQNETTFLTGKAHCYEDACHVPCQKHGSGVTIGLWPCPAMAQSGLEGAV